LSRGATRHAAIRALDLPHPISGAAQMCHLTQQSPQFLRFLDWQKHHRRLFDMVRIRSERYAGGQQACS
jgi:hypothetical protein